MSPRATAFNFRVGRGSGIPPRCANFFQSHCVEERLFAGTMRMPCHRLVTDSDRRVVPSQRRIEIIGIDTRRSRQIGIGIEPGNGRPPQPNRERHALRSCIAGLDDARARGLRICQVSQHEGSPEDHRLDARSYRHPTISRLFDRRVRACRRRHRRRQRLAMCCAPVRRRAQADPRKAAAQARRPSAQPPACRPPCRRSSISVRRTSSRRTLIKSFNRSAEILSTSLK